MMFNFNSNHLLLQAITGKIGVLVKVHPHVTPESEANYYYNTMKTTQSIKVTFFGFHFSNQDIKQHFLS